MNASNEQDKRNKYQPQSHVSDILWHFVGPRRAESYEDTLGRLESFIAENSKFIELGPYTAKATHHIRKLSIFMQKMGVDETPDETKDFTVKEPKSLCFCDIPMGSLPLHMEKYGDVGIGIRRSTINTSFFDKIRPVLYYPCISEETLHEHDQRYWQINNHEIILDNFVKIPTHLDPQTKPIPANNSEEFESIYEEREWRSMSNIQITINELAYILIPDRKYLNFENYPKLVKLIQSGIGLIIAKDTYRTREVAENSNLEAP